MPALRDGTLKARPGSRCTTTCRFSSQGFLPTVGMVVMNVTCPRSADEATRSSPWTTAGPARHPDLTPDQLCRHGPGVRPCQGRKTLELGLGLAPSL